MLHHRFIVDNIIDYIHYILLAIPAELITDEVFKELEELVENAVILDESNIDTSVVSLGSTVKVFHEGLGAELTYDLVGSNEANPAEFKISDQAPIGAALIGKRAGDEIEVEVPSGTVRMKVLEVSRTQA